MDRTENEIKRFLAINVFGNWEETHHLNGFIPHISMDETIDMKKLQLVYHMGGILHLGLINEYFFPNFDQYYNRLKDFVLNADWYDKGESLKILKSADNPHGSYFHDSTIKLPKNLFGDIKGVFFDRIDITVRGINSREFNDHFWYNFDLGYDRAATMTSWSGTRTVKAKCTYVFNEFIYDDALQGVIAAVMSVLMSAYQDCVANGPSRYIGLQTGTKKYAENTRKFLEGGDEPWKKAVGRVMKETDFILKRLENIPKYVEEETFHNIDFDKYAPVPEETIEKASQIIFNSYQFKELDRLGFLLDDAVKKLEDADEREACQIWNRCSKQKVESKKELEWILSTKVMAVTRLAASHLAFWFIYNENQNVRSLRSLR